MSRAERGRQRSCYDSIVCFISDSLSLDAERKFNAPLSDGERNNGTSPVARIERVFCFVFSVLFHSLSVWVCFVCLFVYLGGWGEEGGCFACVCLFVFLFVCLFVCLFYHKLSLIH